MEKNSLRKPSVSRGFDMGGFGNGQDILRCTPIKHSMESLADRRAPLFLSIMVSVIYSTAVLGVFLTTVC